ncbi:OTU-domain-containing protein [Marasmius fiardii PR-910]|nr:OTU-domain-containing protein [Marasmius fiardii PR-910]
MGKKNKLKKMISPSQNSSPAPILHDDDLMDDLIAQIETNEKVEQRALEAEAKQKQSLLPAEKKQDSKSRFEARQARKAAALAQTFVEGDPEFEARLEKEAKEEERAITRICDELGVQLFEINPDGHCLFSAVADQLALLSLLPASQANYATIRSVASNYLYTHPDDFLPFLPSGEGEDGLGAQDPGLMSSSEYERYCQSIRDTAMWGGEPEILALSRAFKVPIHVIQSGTPPVVIHNPTGTPFDGDLRDPKVVRISYHRRMYGLGEHYNSLRPKSKFVQSIQNIF